MSAIEFLKCVGQTINICFVFFMMMDLPYISDHQVGYSAGEYSLSPRWVLTWYIYPFFQDKTSCTDECSYYDNTVRKKKLIGEILGDLANLSSRN